MLIVPVYVAISPTLAVVNSAKEKMVGLDQDWLLEE